MKIPACCFTGHRHIPPAHIAPLTEELDAALRAFYQLECRTFLAGGALGFDTLAAERVLEMKRTYPDVRLVLLLPCRDQCRGWPPAAVARYRRILAAADGVEYIREAYDARVMQDRNMALVARADGCLCYLENPSSGTGQTVRAAEAKGIPVINLATHLKK